MKAKLFNDNICNGGRLDVLDYLTGKIDECTDE